LNADVVQFLLLLFEYFGLLAKIDIYLILLGDFNVVDSISNDTVVNVQQKVRIPFNTNLCLIVYCLIDKKEEEEKEEEWGQCSQQFD
jgi:hypothetical protein